jgi:hypothetical protein
MSLRSGKGEAGLRAEPNATGAKDNTPGLMLLSGLERSDMNVV